MNAMAQSIKYCRPRNREIRKGIKDTQRCINEETALKKDGTKT